MYAGDTALPRAIQAAHLIVRFATSCTTNAQIVNKLAYLAQMY